MRGFFFLTGLAVYLSSAEAALVKEAVPYEHEGAKLEGYRLERIAYNALPGTFTPDFWAHQYDQQTNQVLCTVAKRNWSSNGDHANIFGLEPNYGCCTANLHQGWPKFVSHLWMASSENGLAAVAYGPCVVDATVGDGVRTRIFVETDYPFNETVALVCGLRSFPL